MKRVALVAPHFPPSNLASVHRSRLWAQHLWEFGWIPTIVTTHWRHYEEPLDWALHEMVAPDLAIVRTPAIPTKPVRLVGDIGVRGFFWHLRALERLRRQGSIDFVHITIPSFYSALLGDALYAREPLAFGIDYIDPWVHVWPQAERLGKAWVSMKLGETLEPTAVRRASLITGVAEGYYAGVFERNRALRNSVVTAAMPYGNSRLDFEHVRRHPAPPSCFDPTDGKFHMIYAGAMLPKAAAPLESLFAALVLLRSLYPAVYSRLRVHFVGTGKSPIDPSGHNVMPRANELELGDVISEHPARIPFLDVLNNLSHASAILILGSTEPHYSPSKIYQSVQAGRPIFALLHEDSTAVQVLERSNAGVSVTFTEHSLPRPNDLARALANFVIDPGYAVERVAWREFDAFSARESARALADAMNAACDAFGSRRT